MKKRKYKRLNLGIKVYFQVKGKRGKEPSKEMISGVSKNISVEGICFASKTRLRAGSKIGLDILFPAQSKPVHLEGEVKWSRPIQPVKGKKVFETGAKLFIFAKSHENRFISSILQEFNQAEDVLKESMEIKSQFTSMVSHELRTPLTAIKEAINIVLDGSAGEINDVQQDFLDTAKRNVDRLARLIDDVLDFQKLESGKIQFNLQPNSINEVVEEVHKTMLPSAKDKKIDFIIKLDDSLSRMKFDKDRITQVLTNLVNNAIHFTECGRITLTTGKYGVNSVFVSVKDTGRGIGKEDLPKLFHKFEQLSDTRERKTGGTGLGLAISKEIVSRHQGKIWAESKLGQGSTFKFVLPVKERRG